MQHETVFGLAGVVVLVGGLNARADFFVEFEGPPPSPPFGFHNQFFWDDPEEGLATMNTRDPHPNQSELLLDAADIPGAWDPNVAGSYEVTCRVVSHSSGEGAGYLEFRGTDGNYSWTVTWGENFVSLDIQFEQIEVGNTDFIFPMDTTGDFHTYRVDWDPSVPSATLFVDDEDTGITLGAALMRGRGRADTSLTLGDAFSSSLGGEIIFECYGFTAGEGVDPEVCDDGVDNDGDGDTDCADARCLGYAVCPELCDDGVDYDGNGDTDCLHSVCQGEPAGPAEGARNCHDGQDNDLDGDIDCADADCEGDPSCDDVSSFSVDFAGRPFPPFFFNNEFLWDDPEEELATMKTNQDGQPGQMELSLDASAVPGTWDPSVAGSYEITCQVINSTAGFGAGALEFFYAGMDYSWTVTWGENSVSLDIQFEQIEVGDESFSFPMDTTDDFHTYRVDWDPEVPSATLFVDDEDTGITLGADLLSNSRGRTELVLGDAYSGTLGGQIVFDHYSFEAAHDDGGGFRRGEVNLQGAIDLADAVYILNWLFLGGPSPDCVKSADVNDSGTTPDLGDSVYLLGFLFLGGPPPPAPFGDCGEDPTPDEVPCESNPPCDP